MTIEIKNLSKQYNNISAVKNINLNINKGTIVGLLGPNGCGKTTTIGMLLGLIKPTSGNVYINGNFTNSGEVHNSGYLEVNGNYYEDGGSVTGKRFL